MAATAQADGRRIIELAPVEHVRIELPNSEFRNFGEDFEASLTTRLIHHPDFLVGNCNSRKNRVSGLSEGDPAPDFAWTGGCEPAARLKISVEALSFETGTRGNRMFYGFDERIRSPFNDGSGTLGNEYPLKELGFEPNWFDRTFDPRGDKILGTHAGLDLGDGINFNVLFAWLGVKYAEYHAFLKLKLELDAPMAGRKEIRHVSVSGSGFFFDISGGYQGFSGGIAYAQTDAMLKALRRSIDASMDSIVKAFHNLPLTAVVDAIATDPETGNKYVLVGTGSGASVSAGTVYESVDLPGYQIRVLQSVLSGSVGEVVVGDLDTLESTVRYRTRNRIPPIQLREVSASTQVASAVTSSISFDDIVLLPREDITRPDFKPGQTPSVTESEALARSVVETITLGIRLFRNRAYDRDFAQKSDQRQGKEEFEREGPASPADRDLNDLETWVVSHRKTAWAKNTGLNKLAYNAKGRGPVVAILDTGVDYNHPVLHGNIWKNPAPVTDNRGETDRYGWDFISGDGRPADDAYHGTQLASLVLVAEPRAQLMPLKIFNPWGITNSGSIYSAFVYAVDHGADIILCGWATRRGSQALEQGIAYAETRGVLVVTAAGDRGDSLEVAPAYPAAYSLQHRNVLAVAAVDENDALVQEPGKFSNYDSTRVGMAAPGSKMIVAEPRASKYRDTSTAYSAALVAGAAARLKAAQPSLRGTDLIQELQRRAKVVPALSGQVQGGYRLQVSE